MGGPTHGTWMMPEAYIAAAARTAGGRYGLQTMCEGGGMANVTIGERLN